MAFILYFFHKVMSKLKEEQKHVYFENNKVCRVQKEYPIAFDLDKSRRQNWEISVIEKPIEKVNNI